MRKNKNKLLSLCILGLAILISGCQEPEELIPTAGNKLTTLSFLTSDLIDTKITVEDTETEGAIVIDADINGLKTTDMTKINVSAIIPNNAKVEPPF
ncbi:MAG: hypothetical protein GX792_07380, partial [Bacteroidales bacterium]|nr:hypothetical protein [Bacteroidales bacterium]